MPSPNVCRDAHFCTVTQVRNATGSVFHSRLQQFLQQWRYLLDMGCVVAHHAQVKGHLHQLDPRNGAAAYPRIIQHTMWMYHALAIPRSFADVSTAVMQLVPMDTIVITAVSGGASIHPRPRHSNAPRQAWHALLHHVSAMIVGG